MYLSVPFSSHSLRLFFVYSIIFSRSHIECYVYRVLLTTVRSCMHDIKMPTLCKCIRSNVMLISLSFRNRLLFRLFFVFHSFFCILYVCIYATCSHTHNTNLQSINLCLRIMDKWRGKEHQRTERRKKKQQTKSIFSCKQ